MSKISPVDNIEYPVINPIPHGISRPFWSVMIPTYNPNVEYLEQVLNCVLEQDPGPDGMQIELVDDCSTKNDPEAVVKKIGSDRVSFYRHPHNVGIGANWNECIKRARSYWVHILHQDDLILPGFYRSLQEALEKEPTAGAAFCRHALIDENGQWKSLSPLERDTPGFLPNLLERLAVVQLIQTASIIVRRSTYEQLGGFHTKLHYALDWEMWKRIAAHYPVWYEPQTLAFYRIHSSSASYRLFRSNEDISDIRRSIEISETYLSKMISTKLSRKAREHYALYAVNTTGWLFSIGDRLAAITRIWEALRCSHSTRVVSQAVRLFIWAGTRWIWRLVRKVANAIARL